jgi:hypothetical protein
MALASTPRIPTCCTHECLHVADAIWVVNVTAHMLHFWVLECVADALVSGGAVTAHTLLSWLPGCVVGTL